MSCKLISSLLLEPNSVFIMDSDSDTPVGVKMLADHLVKVKLQYEGVLI